MYTGKMHNNRIQDAKMQNNVIQDSKNVILNALTIDVEDWYQTHDFNIDICKWADMESRVENNTGKILDLLEKHSVHATFFILGCVAGKCPKLIKEISARGHEIGTHGGWHRKVYGQTMEEFREDLLLSKHQLEDLIGKKVLYYRAPSWSISNDTMWALNILEEEGFICDSSIQPFKSPLSGISGAPIAPFHPVINGRKLNLLEFPPTVLKVGWFTLPFAGGLYLRMIPFTAIRHAMKNVNSKRQGMVYLHPWEIDTKQPRLNVPMHIKLIHYMNLNTTVHKLEGLLKNFNFAPLGEVIKENSYPSMEIM
jgi:polysaccharide deacetylase family protein (PEP-CTERM system associated)